MILKVLMDNNTIIDRYFYGEPGVSYLIEDNDIRILFDMGYSDAFIKNAQKLNENLLNLDYLVVSHGHIDHTWGLVPLVQMYTEARIEGLKHKIPSMVAHPEAFLYKEYKGVEEIGSILDQEKLGKHFKMELTRKPMWLTDNIVFLGEIERINDFENTEPLGSYQKDGVMHEDNLIDDSALACKTPEGLVIITGCSHAGICNIVEQAKRICGDDRVVDIIGGFHLLDPGKKQMDGTKDYFNSTKIKTAHACHCTDLNSKIELSKVVDIKEVGSGLILKY